MAVRVIAGSEVFAIAFNIDRNFVRSSTTWKQRRPDKHLLQYRTEASPSSCVRCRLLVPFTILSVSLVCYYYFFLHLNALVHVLNISSVTDKGQTGAARRLTCNGGGDGAAALLLLNCRASWCRDFSTHCERTDDLKSICIADYLYFVITKIEIQF